LPSKQTQVYPLLGLRIELHWKYSGVSPTCIDYTMNLVYFYDIYVGFKLVEWFYESAKLRLPYFKIAFWVTAEEEITALDQL